MGKIFKVKQNNEIDNILLRISKYLEQEIYKNCITRDENINQIIKIAETIKR